MYRKCCTLNICLQKSASIEPRTSPPKRYIILHPYTWLSQNSEYEYHTLGSFFAGRGTIWGGHSVAPAVLGRKHVDAQRPRSHASPVSWRQKNPTFGRKINSKSTPEIKDASLEFKHFVFLRRQTREETRISGVRMDARKNTWTFVLSEPGSGETLCSRYAEAFQFVFQTSIKWLCATRAMIKCWLMDSWHQK